MGAQVPRPRSADDVARWLRTKPSLAEMRAAFPQEWAHVEGQVGQLAVRNDPGAVTALLAEVSRPRRATPDRMRTRPVVVAEAVRRQMLIEALRQTLVSSQTRTEGTTLRLGRINGTVLQRLLFHRGLQRKAAGYRLFRLVWPLLTQRRRLMPLVAAQGIYCFWSDRLVRGLARLIDDRPCIEIAAGDGTLAALLTAWGTPVVATDDGSWGIEDRTGAEVEPLDAAQALRRYDPAVVVCAWPPPGNSFERKVFEAPGVEMYILITSRHRSAAGNWADYEAQAAFEMREEPRLSKALLPPGADGMVLVFRRRCEPAE
ncbi:SAM-dependent methyltransferase [Spongisporangium articulatum]|uniref:SAM-dependent methyltransferase n=1 Tax=Spongisporangium articulatum TaxID=3362603 RepID=A0ABW8AHQ5_9ACTN